MTTHHYLTRLTHNSLGWKRPSGHSYKSNNSKGKVFEAIYDFGFEEWLFAEKHRIGNFQYGYIEGLNTLFNPQKSQNLPLILFSLKYKQNRSGPSIRSFEALIHKWEFLSDWKSEVPNPNIQKQWYDGMNKDLSAVLDGQKLRDAYQQLTVHYNAPPDTPKPLFNVRFSVDGENVSRSVNTDGIDLGRYNRFKLYTV